MTDPTRPATGYPAQPQPQPPNGYPPPPNGYPPPAQQPAQNNYYYPNYNQHQQPPQYYPPPPNPRAVFFRRFISALIATFIIFSVILFIIWLILRPRVPLFTLTSLTLTSLHVAPSPSSFSATCTANFTVTNPNHKLHVYYDQFTARLYYNSAFLTQNELPPFDQRKKNSTVLIATLVATAAYLDPKIVRLFQEESKDGKVRVDLQMAAVVWFNSGGWRARKRYLRVLCDDLPVNVSGNGNGTSGSLVGGSRRCAVVI